MDTEESHDMVQYVWAKGEAEIFLSIIRDLFIFLNHGDIRSEAAEKYSFISRPPAEMRPRETKRQIFRWKNRKTLQQKDPAVEGNLTRREFDGSGNKSAKV